MAGMARRPGRRIARSKPGPNAGVTLRPIQAAKPISRSFAPVKRLARCRDYPRPGHCVQDATVQFYADGPSDPTGPQSRILDRDSPCVPDDLCRVRAEEEIADRRAPAVSDPALRQMLRPVVQHVAALTERTQVL